MAIPNNGRPIDEVTAAFMGEPLSCHRYSAGDCTVLAVAGDIDESSAPDFRRELEAAIAQQPDAPVVVDLSGVTFLGCAGIGELVQALRRAGWVPGSIRLAGGSVSVRRVLDLTRVRTVCPTYESLEVALAERP